MSGKSFVSIYLGSPQLEQLNDDLRAAEMAREAPSLMVSETQYKAMSEESWRNGDKLYELVNRREFHAAASKEATFIERSLGTFRLKTGGLGYFVLLS